MKLHPFGRTFVTSAERQTRAPGVTVHCEQHKMTEIPFEFKFKKTSSSSCSSTLRVFNSWLCTGSVSQTSRLNWQAGTNCGIIWVEATQAQLDAPVPEGIPLPRVSSGEGEQGLLIYEWMLTVQSYSSLLLLSPCPPLAPCLRFNSLLHKLLLVTSWSGSPSRSMLAPFHLATLLFFILLSSFLLCSTISQNQLPFIFFRICSTSCPLSSLSFLVFLSLSFLSLFFVLFSFLSSLSHSQPLFNLLFLFLSSPIFPSIYASVPPYFVLHTKKWCITYLHTLFLPPSPPFFSPTHPYPSFPTI